jgi:hypothetical protein
MKRVEYRPIPEMSRDEVEGAIRRDDPEEVSVAVLSAALHSDDPEWAESVCLYLAAHQHPSVRGNAVLGFGHLSRLHGSLDEPKVKPVIESALHDPDAYVRGQAECAADDVEHFLKWKLRRGT